MSPDLKSDPLYYLIVLLPFNLHLVLLLVFIARVHSTCVALYKIKIIISYFHILFIIIMDCVF